MLEHLRACSGSTCAGSARRVTLFLTRHLAIKPLRPMRRRRERSDRGARSPRGESSLTWWPSICARRRRRRMRSTPAQHKHTVRERLREVCERERERERERGPTSSAACAVSAPCTICNAPGGRRSTSRYTSIACVRVGDCFEYEGNNVADPPSPKRCIGCISAR